MKPTIQIISSGSDLADKIASAVIEIYNLPEMVSVRTGLSWKRKRIVLKHENQETANFSGSNAVLINFYRGIWMISGIVHELVHLILKQNRWNQRLIIKRFIKEHPQLTTRADRKGYLIEQMLAYLIQGDINQEIGRKEGLPPFISWLDQDKIKEILESEYADSYARGVGETIVKEWKEYRGENLIDWIEKLVRRL